MDRRTSHYLLPRLVQELGTLIQVSLGAFFDLGLQFGLLLLQFLNIDTGSSEEYYCQANGVHVLRKFLTFPCLCSQGQRLDSWRWYRTWQQSYRSP